MRDFLLEFLRLYPHIPPQALWRAIEARLLHPLTFPEPIMDLGCGDGIFARVLFSDKKVNKIFGCDENIAYVKPPEFCSISQYQAVADGRYLPYADHSFGTVLSNCVLEHIVEDEKVLKEISRALVPGGKLVFTVPSEYFVSNLRRQDRSYVEKLNRRLAHFHYRSPREWERLLARYGLTVADFSYYLPRAVQQEWERLTQLFLKKVAGIEVCALLGVKRLGINRVMGLFSTAWAGYLRKWYLMGKEDDGRGGGLLIIAYKSV